MFNPTAVSPVPSAAVEAYLAPWNETDAARRQRYQLTCKRLAFRCACG
jgi:hypothetical protein